jgi:hypothetical protein
MPELCDITPPEADHGRGQRPLLTAGRSVGLTLSSHRPELTRLGQLDEGEAAMATRGDEEILPTGSGEESFEAVVARVHAVLLL